MLTDRLDQSKKLNQNDFTRVYRLIVQGDPLAGIDEKIIISVCSTTLLMLVEKKITEEFRRCLDAGKGILPPIPVWRDGSYASSLQGADIHPQQFVAKGQISHGAIYEYLKDLYQGTFNLLIRKIASDKDHHLHPFAVQYANLRNQDLNSDSNFLEAAELGMEIISALVAYAELVAGATQLRNVVVKSIDKVLFPLARLNAAGKGNGTEMWHYALESRYDAERYLKYRECLEQRFSNQDLILLLEKYLEIYGGEALISFIKKQLESNKNTFRTHAIDALFGCSTLGPTLPLLRNISIAEVSSIIESDDAKYMLMKLSEEPPERVSKVQSRSLEILNPRMFAYDEVNGMINPKVFEDTKYLGDIPPGTPLMWKGYNRYDLRIFELTPNTITTMCSGYRTGLARSDNDVPNLPAQLNILSVKQGRPYWNSISLATAIYLHIYKAALPVTSQEN